VSGKWIGRAEWIALMLGCGLLVAWHAGDVRWGRFVIAFALIDLVGYLPGARAFHRARGGRIAAIYHHLYNVTHNFLTAGVAVAIWAALSSGFEWAMLAIPLHLAGDRGIFGNGWKPTDRPFERLAVQVQS
jgi:hypothetical protein